VKLITSRFLVWLFMLAFVACKMRTSSEVDINVILGNAEQGYHHLINSDYMGCGIPKSFISAADSNHPLKKWLTSPEPSIFTLKQPELPGREGPNLKLPYYLNGFTLSKGTEVVNFNCLACHGERVQGKVVIGLGNITRDFTVDLSGIKNHDFQSFFKTEVEKKEWLLWQRRLAIVAPFITAETVGVNPLHNMVYASMAWQDFNDLSWREKAIIERPLPKVIPVDVPPWWRLKFRRSVFYNAQFQGDHRRMMMLSTLNCVDNLLKAQKMEQMYNHIDAYATSLRAPKYPYKIDYFLAEKGHDIFNERCSSCHGIYAITGVQYREVVIPWDIIKTDSELWRFQYYESQRFTDWLSKSWYGELGHSKPANGYIAPPLNGIWITAPYFHNGSVPTIEGVLNSQKRPAVWRRYQKLDVYDQGTLGWKFADLTRVKDHKHIPAKFIYDTSKKGYANTGHDYGDNLSATQRKALIEYLKTL